MEKQAQYRTEFDPTPHLREVRYTIRKTGEVVVRQVLDAAPRIAWFRAEHPIDSGWRLVSAPREITDEYAEFVAAVLNPEGQVVSTGYRRVYRKDFAQYIEKAETQAKGRALEGAGYGLASAVTPEESEAGGNGASAKPSNPAEAIRTQLHEAAARFRKDREPSSQQLRLLTAKMAEALQDSNDKPRHLVIRWLWDLETGSSEELSYGAVGAMLRRWVSSEADGTGDYPLCEQTVAELQIILRQAQVDAGQLEMPLEEDAADAAQDE